MRIACVGFGRRSLRSRSTSLGFLLIALAMSGSLLRTAADEIPLPHPGSWRREATLRDVTFVNALQGWACGDRGTLLRTDDGGQNWLVVPTSVDCRLDSISFVDDRHGWAVGGFEAAGSERRIGVVVATEDGGRTWHRLPNTGVPWLHRVRFADRRNGFALGEVSARQRSGMFITRDGGQNWVALTGFAPQGWLDGDTSDRATFAVVGARGGMFRFEGDRFEPAPALDGLVPRLKRVRFSASGIGWAIGERGLVYRSHDQGRSWRSALDRSYLPGIEQVEWTALAVLDDQVWIGGFPAGLALHSPDAGATWNVMRTGLEGEINSLHFIDGRVGWAVGSMGRIATTADGGASWTIQRNGLIRPFLTLSLIHI